MKLRLDFVTNSSSVSYICDVCGEVREFNDTCLGSGENTNCENEHYFCQAHVPNFDEIRRELFTKRLQENPINDDDKETMRDWKEFISIDFSKETMNVPDSIREFLGYPERDDLPSELCPLCSLKTLNIFDEVSYYRTRFGITTGEALEDIRRDLKTYAGLRAFIDILQR